jgi:hypothetical protein
MSSKNNTKKASPQKPANQSLFGRFRNKNAKKGVSVSKIRASHGQGKTSEELGAESQQFDVDLAVRMSVMPDDGYDAYSSHDDDDGYSQDGSVFLEEDEEEEEEEEEYGEDDVEDEQVQVTIQTSPKAPLKYAPPKPLNASRSDESDDDDDDDVYLDDGDKKPVAEPPQIAESVQLLDKLPTVLEDRKSEKKDYDDISIELSVDSKEIDKLIDDEESRANLAAEVLEVRKKEASRQFDDREDSAGLLAQLSSALSVPRIDIVDSAPGSDDLESEFENVAKETDRLAAQLRASYAKAKTLQEKLIASKARAKRLEEIGEQVNMARPFALQSLKVTDIEIPNEIPMHKPALETFDEDEEDEEEEAGGIENADDEEESETHPSIVIRAVSSKDSGNWSSPEEKLRKSMERVKRMEEMGDQIRNDPSLDFAEIKRQEEVTLQQFIDATDDLRQTSNEADMQYAEILELHSRLQEQQNMIEELEQERDYHASKVAELTELLRLTTKDEIGEHLAEKSLLVAELGHEVSVLRKKLQESEERAAALKAERDANKSVVVELSESIWSSGKQQPNNPQSEEAAKELIEKGGVIPENSALEMTITHLQKKIEQLEEEKAEFMNTVTELQASINEITQENEARELKISALESQFLLLNQRGDVNMPIHDSAPDSSDKLLRFKAWATDKISKAQDQFETIKQDIELRRVNTNPDQILSSS